MKYESKAPMNWVRYAMQWIIDDAVETTPPNGIWVEVGVGAGRGIGYMARALIEAGRDDITLYAVDPWAGHARCGEQTRVLDNPGRHGDWIVFLDHMLKYAQEELKRIHILRLSSADAARMFLAKAERVDLAIIDADHSHDAVLDDINKWGDAVRFGGVIGGDDIVADSDVERAVLGKWPDVERRGNPHSAGGQADWPTWRKVRDWPGDVLYDPPSTWGRR